MIKKITDSPLKSTERQALTFVRNRIMHTGEPPSVRELAKELGFSSPRSAVLVINSLIEHGYLKRREDDRSLQLLRMPQATADRESTVDVPLVGSAPCGAPLLAQENLEAMIQVSTTLARPGRKYFLLRANGDSMNGAGISDGSLVLVRQQETANDKEIVVALVDDEATIKELRRSTDAVALVPRSSNPAHRPIVLRRDFQVQGVVIATLPDVSTDTPQGATKKRRG
ncbi:MAG: transcriptional repressor LexA [Hyphomicrobium sp.]